MNQEKLKALLDEAILDAACVAMAGMGTPPARVDECGPQALALVQREIKSYAALAAALGIEVAQP